MSDLILYHYELSPFSEKVRALLGHAGLGWQSVIVPAMPPRPIVEALAGGYRKIPVAQLGADLFCDSRTIATHIAARSGKPQLALENLSPDQQKFVAHVDLEVFFAVVATSLNLSALRRMHADMSLSGLVRFFADRIRLGRDATFRVPGRDKARQVLRAHLEDLQQRLSSSDFVFGDAPNHADFSCYHSLWMAQTLAATGQVERYPAVRAWMQRMAAFGHGRRREISEQQAREAARSAKPLAIDPAHTDDPLIGQPVAIRPTDYAQDLTRGVLVASGPASWTLAREATGAGRVHVHFPKPGYTLERG